MKEISSLPDSGGSRTSKRRRNAAPGRGGKPRCLSVGERQLTTREKEILRFLAFGLGTSAIARELSISPATVRNHAQRILAKLQVHSRLAAVARGYAIGLLPSPRWRSSAPAPAVEPPPV
jgi:DNA-binding NarL/FixJ family response regulator